MKKKGFVLIKPEALQRNLVGKVISTLEDKGLKIIALKMLQPTKEQIFELYKQYKDLPHFSKIIECTTDGPVVAIVVSIVGELDPSSIISLLQGRYDIPGTIRHAYSPHISRNVVHCSDDYILADKEIPIFFSEEEIYNYNKVLDQYLID
ncbi:nucleoside-diphosphate kinase [Viridibacillus arvi]|uniref:nucleoside-diphosphate kinase n=1 Tax=Viridibacillus arvi TaxID=263475 RepID=UPI0034CE71FA